MECEVFWKRYPDVIDKAGMDNEMRGHLNSCPRCRVELDFLTTGLEGMRKEIEEDEGPEFWRQLRADVRSEIRIPGKRSNRFLPWWNAGLATASLLLIVTIFGGFFLPTGHYTEDLSLYVESLDPVSSVYEEAAAVEVVEEDEVIAESDYLRGIVDWSSLLIDAYGENRIKGRRNYHEKGISGLNNFLNYVAV